MYGLTPETVTVIERAWIWLTKQPNFYRARLAQKTFSGKVEEIVEKARIIRTYNEWFKQDLFSPKMQNEYIQDVITIGNATKINANLSVKERFAAISAFKKDIDSKQKIDAFKKEIDIKLSSLKKEDTVSRQKDTIKKVIEPESKESKPKISNEL